MIIQSKFTDYYDPLVKTFRDEAVVYYRKEERCVDPKSPELIDAHKLLRKYMILPTFRQFKPYYLEVSLHCVVFCGKVFPVIVTDISSNRSKFDYVNIEENLRQHLNYTFWTDKQQTIYSKIKGGYFGEGMFDKGAKEYNEKYKAPIVYYDGRSVTLNPCLKELDFHVHPYTLVQELMMFFQSKKPYVPEPTNQNKVDSHGFNKGSFRRERGGPTRKKKKLN